MPDKKVDFLNLSELGDKPRRVGVTHVLDPGIPLEDLAAKLNSYSDCVDVWKFGWGTAYVEPRLTAKMALLRDHGVIACIGGTLLEIAWAQGRATQCLEWAKRAGFRAIEVSRGTVAMGTEAKQLLIRQASQDFVVYAETGYKSEERTLLPSEWYEEITEDIGAGASYIIAEGRESGTVGVYDASGKPIAEVVKAVIEAAGLERALFETPRKDQQSWFINNYGANVNLGNIASDDLLPLRTLRLGLRGDTVSLALGEPASNGFLR